MKVGGRETAVKLCEVQLESSIIHIVPIPQSVCKYEQVWQLE